MEIFNTENKRVEPVQTQISGKANFYCCGPTVYNFAHIGNLRAYITADILVRTLELNQIQTRWAMNITDIDDKTIASTLAVFGNDANTDKLAEFTSKYTDAFLQDLKEIGVNKDRIEFVNVSDVIPEIQKFIIRLIDLGFAYKAEDGSTYFSIPKYQEKFGTYGALVGERFLEGTKPGARVSSDEYDKDNIADFALWKAHNANDGNIFWDHPLLGKGRPGWHIECTLINYLKFPLGTDIHSGGIDLIFPHHTNEIAQAEPIYKPFVRQWLHSGHIMVDGKKMSKSLGNFYTLGDIKTKHLGNGQSLRFLILQSHYRSKLNITEESLLAAKAGLNNIHSQIKQLLESVEPDTIIAPLKTENELVIRLHQYMNQDLDSSSSIALISEIFKSDMPNKEKLSTFIEFEKALGLELIPSLEDEQITITEEVQILKSERDRARAEKDYSRSDKLRTEIEQFGFEVLDTAQGTKVKKLD